MTTQTAENPLFRDSIEIHRQMFSMANQFNPGNTEAGTLEESLLIQDFTFELRTVIGSRYLENDKWDGVTISRHGGVFFLKWWLDERIQNQPVQIEVFPWHNLPYNDNYTLVPCHHFEDHTALRIDSYKRTIQHVVHEQKIILDSQYFH